MCSNEENIYGDSYYSLNLAKLACNKDSDCFGVQKLDFTNTVFRLCKKGVRKPYKHNVHIYEKQLTLSMSKLVSFLIIASCFILTKDVSFI